MPTHLVLSAALLLATAAAHAATPPKPEQVTISSAQIGRAGIATVPALATLADAGAGGIVLTGTVVPPLTAIAVSGSNWGGVVQQIHATTLQTVRAGTPLVTLFSQPWMELQRDYVQLATQARLATEKRHRDEGLFKDGIISRVRLDESRSAAQLATLAASQRRQELRAGGLGAKAIDSLTASHDLSPMLTVRAQAAGTVLELPLAIGQHAEAGTVLAKIVRDGPLWAELQASRQQLPSLPLGAVLQVADGCRLKVTAISPLVNGANQTAQVRAEQIDRNACLKVNAFIEARLVQPATQAGALAVPATALVRRGATDYVFIRNATGFSAVPVQTAAHAGNLVWVRGALPAGAPVVNKGVAAIKGAWTGLGEPAAEDGAKGQP